MHESEYQPKFQPKLSESPASLSAMRYNLIKQTKRRYKDDPDTDPVHYHTYLEIFYNISSDVSFLVNNNLYPVPIGDAIVTRSGDLHMGIFNSNEIQSFVCIWIDADFKSSEFAFLNNKSFSPLYSLDSEARQRMRSLIFSLVSAHEEGGTELEKAAYLVQILALLEKTGTNREENSYIPIALQRILDDIHQNFASIKSVNDILRTHFISSATLTRWFRKYIHSSPRAYLESIRLSNATRMLAGGASVTDACMNSGFSDCSHFIALFKKRFGKTPYCYKKMNIRN